MSSSKLVSVAIDFGTTFSGYAFSFRHDKENIQTYLWKAKNYESPKTPTCILFDPTKSFHSFGLEAEDKYAELSRAGVSTSWYFFKQFKLALHNTQSLGRQTSLKERGKKEMPALDVFAESIRYLKEHAIGQLAKSGGAGISESDIQWVLTVPAIWDDSARQFMRHAAEKAGILENDLSLAFEPEAASIYCRTLENEIFHTVGTKYLVLDCGGGTVDVAAHTVEMEGKLKAIYRPSGGVWGGTKVDDEFQAFLAKICGVSAITSLSKHDMIEVQRAFELAKTKATPVSQSYIHVKVPVQLLSSLNLEMYDGKYRRTGDKLSLSNELMKQFFGKSINKIKEHIKTLLDSQALLGVQHIVMVGGFSQSEVLQDAIKHEFVRQRIHLVPHAESAVVRGAVLFGHEPKTIRWRKAAFTYGTSVAIKFQENQHDWNKRTLYGSDIYCSDIFDVWISINDTLEVGRHKIQMEYTPLLKDQTVMVIGIYRSTEAYPKYTTDPGCLKIGSITVEMPDLTGGKDRPVTTTIEFGDTELKVEAVNTKTGEKFTAQFDFLAT